MTKEKIKCFRCDKEEGHPFCSKECAEDYINAVESQLANLKSQSKAIFDEELFLKKFTKTEREILEKKYGVEQ